MTHLAFQIRQLYGRQEALQRRWNIDGARKVFAFVFGEPSVRRLIHFSTVTAYGAHPGNALAAPFRERDVLNERDYLYGSHKREIEGLLAEGMRLPISVGTSLFCAARRSVVRTAASLLAASASFRL